jgi:hypothetical protein
MERLKTYRNKIDTDAGVQVGLDVDHAISYEDNINNILATAHASRTYENNEKSDPLKAKYFTLLSYVYA